MSFEYAGYKIQREDERNVCLYKWDEVTRKPKDAPEFNEMAWVWLGFYNTFFGAARAMITRLAERANNIEELKKILSQWDFIAKELDK